MLHGNCLCGGVAFSLTGKIRPVIACHCQQCRKTSGHYWAATSVKDEDILFSSKESLRWYRSSDTAQRGFCQTCGSTLFWKPEGQNRLVVSAGALNGPTDLEIAAHVFVEEKGDYYDIDPNVPRYSGFSGAEEA